MQEKEVIFTDNFYPKAQNIEIKRLLYAIELLINSGEIKSFKSIAEKAGYKSQDFTDMKTGRKSLQLDFLDCISNITCINKSWIITGEGEILKKTSEQSVYELKNQQKSLDFNRLFEVLERRDRQVDRFLEAIERRDNKIDELITLLKESHKPNSSDRENENKEAI